VGSFGHQGHSTVNSLEQECYNPVRSAEGGGYVSIEAVSQSCDGFGYASDLLSTDPVQNVKGGGFQFTYGFMEARIYVPDNGAGGVANWPAFWADGQNWPMDGEIDVMEGLGGPVCSTFHYGTSAAPESSGPTCAPGDYSGWHTYGADWEPDSIAFYYDGKRIGRVTQNVTDAPMYLILDYAVTNALGGPGIQVPSTMQVAYVRVWQH
jgi:beta-glucanase (GH16 family)